MSDVASDPEEGAPKKSGMMPILLGVGLSLALGGGGFFAAYSGLLPLGASSDPTPMPTASTEGSTETAPAPYIAADAKDGPVEFVSIEPMVVTLAAPGATRHLRFEAQLEIVPGEAGAIEALMPRILDVLNSYLRAVRLEDLEKPTALLTLRAHMLRRVQLVVGHARVKDLLVTEFILN